MTAQEKPIPEKPFRLKIRPDAPDTSFLRDFDHTAYVREIIKEHSKEAGASYLREIMSERKWSAEDF